MGVNAYDERTTVMAALTDTHLSLVRPVTPRTPGGCEEPGEDWRWCYVDEIFV
jgi:hypothetical protein